MGRGCAVALSAFIALVVGVVVAFLAAAQHEGNQLFSPSASASASAPAVVPATSAAAASPSMLVSDNPVFDLTGSGDACRMHYFADDG